MLDDISCLHGSIWRMQEDSSERRTETAASRAETRKNRRSKRLTFVGQIDKKEIWSLSKNERWIWLRRIKNYGHSSKHKAVVSENASRNLAPSQTDKYLTADDFADFFLTKLNKSDQRRFQKHSPPNYWWKFHRRGLGVILKHQRKWNASHHSSVTDKIAVSTPNLIPTFLLKEALDSVLTYITVMVNASLDQARLQASQKESIVSAWLKMYNLDSKKWKIMAL